MPSTALARRPETIRAEVAADPERRQLLRDATSELLTATQSFIEEYVALPIGKDPAERSAAATLALWTLHTWTLDACDSTPYILILSTEPGSGKSRLLETLSYLVRKPWNTAGTTHTALFRRMSEDRPTLLLDELDTVYRGGASNEPLRAVLNAGNRRGATVTRCDGKWGVREYQTFGCKALCGIDTGFLPATIVDRSIMIPMSKSHGQTVRLRPRIAATQAAPLAHTLEAWGSVVVDELAKLEPELPAQLSDRAADSWEPLLAISAFAGGEWPERARLAAGELSSLSGALMPGEGPGEGSDGLLLPGLAEVMQG